MRIFTPQNEYVMRKLLYLVIGLLFVFALPSGAQPECVFTHYSSEEGLSQNTVMNILQDRKGNMRFATWDGINKFDGYDFRTYKAKFDNRINLTNNRVDYMYEDRYGFLWLLTYDNQAWRFNPRTEVFEHVPAMRRREPVCGNFNQGIALRFGLVAFGGRRGYPPQDRSGEFSPFARDVFS